MRTDDGRRMRARPLDNVRSRFAALVPLALLLAAGCASPEATPGDETAGEPPATVEREPLDEQATEGGRLADPAIGLTDRQRDRLRELGLDDPERDIIADLAERPHLIPEEGVLGGTMYWVPDESAVLTDRWVLATYEDGHVRGRALLDYEVEAADSIRWRLIAARTDS